MIKKFKKQFGFKILLMIVIPMVTMLLALCTIATVLINNQARSMTEGKMKAVCLAVTDSYANMVDGDWTYKNNKLYKGNMEVTTDLIDTLHEQDGVHLTIFYGDTRVLTTITDDAGKRAVGTKADDKVIDVVLKNGGEYLSSNVKINGTKYYAFYEPVKNADGKIVGMIFAGIKFMDIQMQINSITTTMIIMSFVLTVIFITLGVICIKAILKNFRTVEDGLRRVADGNLGENVAVSKINAQDEIGSIADYTNKVCDKLSEIVGAVQRDADILGEKSTVLDSSVNNTISALHEVNDAINGVAQGSTSQASDTANAMAGIEELSANLEVINSQIAQTAKLINDTATANDNAEGVMKELTGINEDTMVNIEEIVKQSENNVEALKKVNVIVETIQAITTQTNLLSLNASIEAARAGEAGKGFAVVATEIGQLANQSREASEEIKNILAELAQSIQESAKKADDLNENANKQALKLAETNELFASVSDNIEEVTRDAARIQESAENIQEIRNVISDTVEGLSAISQENAASSEEVAANTQVINEDMQNLGKICDEVNVMSRQLRDIISYFK